MSLVNCSCAKHKRQALYRRYGRFFAEFLNEYWPVRLRILSSSTRVGLRYGPLIFSSRDFSGEVGSKQFSLRSFLTPSRSPQLTPGQIARICQCDPSTDAKTGIVRSSCSYRPPSSHRKNKEATEYQPSFPSREHLWALRLGPANPGLIIIAQETLDFRRAGFSPA